MSEHTFTVGELVTTASGVVGRVVDVSTGSHEIRVHEGCTRVWHRSQDLEPFGLAQLVKLRARVLADESVTAEAKLILDRPAAFREDIIRDLDVLIRREEESIVWETPELHEADCDCEGCQQLAVERSYVR